MEEIKDNKKISEMTEKEILRRQLELLAEYSTTCNDETVLRLTEKMCQIYELIRDTEIEVVSYHIRPPRKLISDREQGMQY